MMFGNISKKGRYPHTGSGLFLLFGNSRGYLTIVLAQQAPSIEKSHMTHDT